ncbi:PREDICTED: threonine--tRNA ligase, cytoplasmic-like [Amphimedon queenslandica]|uniref:threonine--tRNA ligase n=1 Tax=Amphimedon queenslandica TaxID=400682 RepID=A0AAN0JJ05_AMPQE|nr:PREDICTED: threonine--tRNA ligase, cytoplasmic-like [Amphimedon queenslandica]|eukprot:XP_019856663.1 PREDICTED: threonine--tRNA ligase, cytoplasmic-like [Amphimedon queenslandica]
MYRGESDERKQKRPVIIHRAILGSVERCIAVLTESYGGKWPFWLSPCQVMIVPVASTFDEYGLQVKQRLHDAGFMVDIDLSTGDTMNKKIRNAQLEQFNYILVVGEKEVAGQTVNVRTRDNVVHGEVTLDRLVARLKELKESRTLEDTGGF